MRNLLLTIAYDGADFSGWQRNPGARTVQATIEAVLREMTQDETVTLRVTGRTDAGVHALGQLAAFKTESAIAEQRFLRGLNSLLPDSVSILAVESVPLDYNPRHKNAGKHYRYTIWNHREIAPADKRRAWHIYGAVDRMQMARAARLLVGTHDFAAFRAADCERPSTTRTLYRVTVSELQARRELRIDVEGTAFLKNMVRIIAGTLLDIGRGKLPLELVHELLESGDRTRAGITAPPHGLCLVRVLRP
ncbi:MAG: tRNA pseudouridine(38-40) synthase TruA [Myxococcales bacterium]|nr:tRNA pseudouridine(38-40) synthase TruA [Myxococcales bacterium]